MDIYIDDGIVNLRERNTRWHAKEVNTTTYITKVLFRILNNHIRKRSEAVNMATWRSLCNGALQVRRNSKRHGTLDKFDPFVLFY